MEHTLFLVSTKYVSAQEFCALNFKLMKKYSANELCYIEADLEIRGVNFLSKFDLKEKWWQWILMFSYNFFDLTGFA